MGAGKIMRGEGGKVGKTTLIVGFIITLRRSFPPSYEICLALFPAQRVKINVNARDLTVIMKSLTVIARL